MRLPSDINARHFFRAAKERLEDAQHLLESDPARTTGSVYLAGYAVECALKALILNAEPVSRHAKTMTFFRGAKAHNFDWLRDELDKRTHVVLPQNILECFEILNYWGTDIRYVPTTFAEQDAKDFLTASDDFLKWAEQQF